jgi:hypothetical protein
MKTAIIKQEILLLFTPFYQKELCEKNAPKNAHNLPDAEQFVTACWDGLLDDLLDNIIEKTASGKRLCLWQIQQGNACIQIELCNGQQLTDCNLSVNPYLFLSMMSPN